MNCPNCSHPVAGHPNNGCVLHAFIQLLGDRGNLTPVQLTKLHEVCNVDSLWDRLGPVLDDLEAGMFSDSG